MKNSWSFRNNKVLTVVTLLFSGVVLAVLLGSPTRASQIPLLGSETLTEIALEWARSYGLSGSSEAQITATMTLQKWHDLIDVGLGDDAAKFGLTPGLPVFILAIKGDVEWNGAGTRPPEQEGAEHYDNITIVLNAQNGEPVWIGSYREGHPMPIPIP